MGITPAGTLRLKGACALMVGVGVTCVLSVVSTSDLAGQRHTKHGVLKGTGYRSIIGVRGKNRRDHDQTRVPRQMGR